MNDRVWGIGLPRTGTASLCESLKILGYDCVHYPKYLARAEKHQAAVDTPIPIFYKELSEKYPSSKFILTVRDKESWLLSAQKASKRFRWAGLSPTKRCGPEVYSAHIELFGTLAFDKEKMSVGYDRHYQKVLDYFSNSHNLLIYNLCGGDGWKPLCKFLNKPIPEVDAPHRNKIK